ncbi:hypothetical protein LBMAG52_32850 [Planctomycetia bacterium]|nr:hypothetical protein LBMAG52_32850 [Planctomycetia bacterium]
MPSGAVWVYGNDNRSRVQTTSSLSVIGPKPDPAASSSRLKVRDYRRVFPVIKVPGEDVRKNSVSRHTIVAILTVAERLQLKSQTAIYAALS